MYAVNFWGHEANFHEAETILHSRIIWPRDHTGLEALISLAVCRLYCRLRLAMINLHTKFKVSMFTYHKGVKGNAECRNGVVLGLEVTQGHWQCHHSIKCIDSYASVLYPFRVMSSYLSKVANFILLHLHLAPRCGWSRSPYLRLQKTRVSELSCGVVSVILRLAVLTQYRRVGDVQADGRTDGRTKDTRQLHIPRLHGVALLNRALKFYFMKL